VITRLSTIARYARVVALIDLFLFAAVGVVHLLAGWNTAYQYGGGLTWAGMLVVALGILTLLGGFGLTRNPRYQYGQSVSTMSTIERAQQSMRDTLQGYGCLIVAVAVGAVAIGAGSLIQFAFR
jgi:hypothetical protein